MDLDRGRNLLHSVPSPPTPVALLPLLCTHRSRLCSSLLPAGARSASTGAAWRGRADPAVPAAGPTNAGCGVPHLAGAWADAAGHAPRIGGDGVAAVVLFGEGA
jgi:hypothetical protein